MIQSNIFKLIVVSFMTITFSALAQTQIQGSPDELTNFLYPKGNTVILSGQVEQKAPFDQALFTLEISSKSQQFSKAIEQNKKIRQQISQNLLQAGINGNNIQSDRFSTSKENAWIGKKENYTVNHHMLITLVNNNQLETLAKTIDLFNEVQLVDMRFIHSNKNELENQVRAKALEKVLQQKSFYEKKLGVVLKPLKFYQSPIKLPLTAKNKQLLTQNTSSTTDFKNNNQSSFENQIYRSQIQVEFKVE